ncbi:MAG: ABC transporter ATP-binding protein [Chthoniobacterales bacterium]
MSPVISVENVSKSYRLGTIGGGTLKEDVNRWWARARGKSDPTLKVGEEHHARLMGKEFHALQNVSFQVNEGEVLGIIGRNGAGKSTLLKILSQVTAPTLGEIKIKGRIASLLEVGTGFHPELTGRENVFLNGAILGMTKGEIRRKFDEIVDFSGIEEFIDTPVKRYSSGMYVRLAFAVAAHLESEILIVDEVLAVGDSAFQKKCLGKMDQVSRTNGRTILFVSHNMGVTSSLCRRAMVLEGGRFAYIGSTENAIARYLDSGIESSGSRTWEVSSESPTFQPRAIQILNHAGQVSERIDITQAFEVAFEYSLCQTGPRFRVVLRFVAADGTVAFTSSDSADPSFDQKSMAQGCYITRCRVPGNLMNEGHYRVTLSVDVPFQEVLFVEESAVEFVVEQTGGVNSRFSERWSGAVCPRLSWATELKASSALTYSS